MRTNVYAIIATINHRATMSRKSDADSAREKIKVSGKKKEAAREAIKAKRERAKELEQESEDNWRLDDPFSHDDERIARNQVRNAKELQVQQKELKKADEEISNLHEDLKDIHEDYNGTKKLMNEILDEVATYQANVAS